MRFFCVLFLCVSTVLANPRSKRNDCTAVYNAFQTCLNNAHSAHNEALQGQDDGKPDFYSRKSCNYIQAAVVDCADSLLEDCYTPEEVKTMQASQFAGVVKKLEESAEWESSKCPAVKTYKDLLPVEPVEGAGDATTEDTQEPEGDDQTDNTDTPAATDDTTDDANDDTTDDTNDTPPTDNNGNEDEGNEDDTSAAGALVAAPLIVLLFARLLF